MKSWVVFTLPSDYLDDILICSPDLMTHLKHLEAVFQHLLEWGLKLKELICNFLRKSTSSILRSTLVESETGIDPLPEKLSSLQSMPHTRNLKEVKHFWGLAGYYQKFMLRFADTSCPLTSLTKKDVPFEWTKKSHYPFNLLKTFSLRAQSSNTLIWGRYAPCLQMQVDMFGHVFWNRHILMVWMV